MPDAPPYRYRVTIVSVHDGDTLTVTIDLGFHLTFTTPIRLAGVNAPELGTRAPDGSQPGFVARDALRTFIASFPPAVSPATASPSPFATGWTAQTYKTGNEKYGRWLARVTAPDGTDLSAWLTGNGFAEPYEP